MVGHGTKDPADREFEALLAGGGSVDVDSATAAEKAPANKDSTQPELSDEMFASLMGEFHGLDSPKRATPDKPESSAPDAFPANEKNSVPARPGTVDVPATPAPLALPQLARLLDRIQPLRNRLAEITRQYVGDKSLREYQADADLLAINLQISGLRNEQGYAVFIEAASQCFSLSLEDVFEVIPAPARREYVDDEWVLPWSGRRLPAFSLHDWWISQNKHRESDAEFPVFVLIGHDNPVALLIDRCIGVALSSTQPLGRLLSGSIGLKGISDCKEFGSALVIDVPALGAMLRKRSDDTGSSAGI